MSDLAITERRIRPIQDAVSAGNWKQALQLCDKWQKKGEKSDRFLALKASVLVHQPDKTNIDKGMAETLQLCQRAAPITDIEAIFQLQDNFRRLHIQNEEGPKLWNRAISALPKDKDLIMTWLQSSIRDRDWLMAQKAGMALRKGFPKERQYEFWNMLLCYLAHWDTSISEKERTMFGTLAYRLISKAVEAIPDDKAQLLSPGKAVATVDELALLTYIYIETGRADEAISILLSDKAGLSSVLGDQDPPMVFSLLLRALGASTDAEGVVRTCRQLLSDDNSKARDVAEDDRIWKVLLKAVQPRISLQDEAVELIVSILKRQPDCRAAHLAKLEILTTRVTDNNNDNAKADLIAAVQLYYKQFSEKPFCFDDLTTAIKACNISAISDILAEVAHEDATDLQKMLALRFEYSTLSESNSAAEAFISFAREALQLHRTLSGDKAECPEAVLLAAMGLLRLASRSGNLYFALQASMLLDCTYAKFETYYPIGTRLVQLHRVMGQISMAEERFSGLSVKNMQWETLGHLLLTRISTLQPLPIDDNTESSASALLAIDAALEMMSRMEGSLQKAIKNGLENGSYSNVVDSIEVQEIVKRSLNVRLLMVEDTRIRQLGDVTQTGRRGDNHKRERELIDKRDFSYFNNYNALDSHLEEYLSCGPLPKEMWLGVSRFANHLQDFLNLEVGGSFIGKGTNIHSAGALQSSFQSLKRSLGETAVWTGEDLPTELTEAEISALQCQRQVGEIVVLIKDGRSASSDESITIEYLLDKIQACLALCVSEAGTTLTVGDKKVELPTWKFLHLSFTHIETTRLVNKLAVFLAICLETRKNNAAGKGSKATAAPKTASAAQLPTKERIGVLGQLATNATVSIFERAKEMKKGLDTPGLLGKLIDIVAGRVDNEDADRKESTKTNAEADAFRALGECCVDLFGEGNIEEYCGRMKDSWENALDGIMVLKTDAAPFWDMYEKNLVFS